MLAILSQSQCVVAVSWFSFIKINALEIICCLFFFSMQKWFWKNACRQQRRLVCVPWVRSHLWALYGEARLPFVLQKGLGRGEPAPLKIGPSGTVLSSVLKSQEPLVCGMCVLSLGVNLTKDARAGKLFCSAWVPCPLPVSREPRTDP